MRYALGSLLCLVLVMPLSAAKHDLTGQVNSADGKPLANAHVYIYTGGPREGVSQFCPSCYADCGKRAATNTGGQFRIPTLDPGLLFRVLAVADGYEPQFLARVDPSKGPIVFTLAQRPEGQPDHDIRGRILDPKGKPVVGATVQPNAMRTPRFLRFGGLTDIDALAVSNEKGEFVLRVGDPSNQYDVSVHARDLAPQMVTKLAPGAAPRTIQLVKGATVTGRVVRGSQSVAGIRVGIGQSSRRAEWFLGEVAIGTDKDGKFVITNLPPNEEHTLHAFMSEVAPDSMRLKPIMLGADESRTDAGDLRIVPGRRVAGSVVMPEGKALPPHTRLVVSHLNAMDSQTVELDGKGGFDVSGVPPDAVVAGVAVPGFRVSAESTYMRDRRVLIDSAEKDVTDIRLIMEPAPPLPQRPPP